MRRGSALRFLVVTNIAIYLLWIILGDDSPHMTENFLVSWSGVMDGRLWTLLTTVFSHSLFLHLFINMYVLLGFGSVLESFLGWRLFLKFYLTAGLAGSLGHIFACKWLLDSPDLPALGASGAVSGVVALFALLFPREKILLLGFIPLPAIFGLLLVLSLDLWGLFEQATGHGLPIGHGAHLGGAFFGIFCYLFYFRPKIKSAVKLRTRETSSSL